MSVQVWHESRVQVTQSSKTCTNNKTWITSISAGGHTYSTEGNASQMQDFNLVNPLLFGFSLFSLSVLKEIRLRKSEHVSFRITYSFTRQPVKRCGCDGSLTTVHM